MFLMIENFLYRLPQRESRLARINYMFQNIKL